MAASRSIDRQTFLANVRQSGLLSAEQLATVAPRLPATPRGRLIARELVEMGLLTKFQAEQLLAGRTNGFFCGPYRILEQLGQGGMGRVFKAEHRTLGRVVALKVLAPSLLKTARAQELFLREVRAAAALIHLHIVAAFDADQAAGRYYLVLEYVNGPNLDQLVRNQGPLPVGQACDFIRQTALGLQHAHERGMIHRDVKPANLLLQQSGNGGEAGYGLVKLSDFGLARIQETEVPGEELAETLLTKHNTIMGTPDYLSPEQARDLHNTDIRSDLYSLGCTFYFLLTGKVPFPGGSTLEKLIRHSTEEPIPLEKLRPELSSAVIAIVLRLMAKTPAGRFETPADLAGALVPFSVPSPAAWPASGASGPFADPLATPIAGAGGNSDVLGDSADEDESAALIGTVLPDPTPTPLSAVRLPSSARLADRLTRGQQRRFRVALLWAVGLVGGLLAVGIALSQCL